MRFNVEYTSGNPKTPEYKLEINLMHGHGDYYDSLKIKFSEGEVDNLKALILAVECCMACYPNGRGGLDSYVGLPEYDAFFLSDEYPDPEDHPDIEIPRELELLDDEDKAGEYLQIKLRERLGYFGPEDECWAIPTNEWGTEASFVGYELTHKNNGTTRYLSVRLNENELKHIESRKNYFAKRKANLKRT